MTTKLLILLVTFYVMQICITDAEYIWNGTDWNWQGDINGTSVEESDFDESDLDFKGSGDGLFGDLEGDDDEDYKYSGEYYEDTKIPKELFEEELSASS